MAFAVFALLATLSSTEPPLLKKATLITVVDRWVEFQGGVGLYLWWTPTQVLAFYREEEERLLDIASKKWTPFQTPTLRNNRGKLSPDGKMVIQQQQVSDTITFRITDPSGKKEFGSWKMTSRDLQSMPGVDMGYSPPEAVWSQDGRSVYQIEYWADRGGYHAQVVRRTFPHVEEPHPSPAVTINDRYPDLKVYDGKILLTHYNWPDPKQFPIREWNLAEPIKTQRRWMVAAPKGRVILDYIPSPDYKRALWVMGVPGAQPLTDAGYPYRSISLWTSGLHGEQMAEVGVIPFNTEDVDKQMEHYQYFGGLLWNPDCKQVSFIYYRKLYLVRT